MAINGSYTTWKDLELTYLDWTTRESAQEGSAPTDLPLKELNINGPGTKIINCIIHDLRQFGAWTPAVGTEIYGNVIYHLGWNGPDRQHGHALYTQGAVGTRRVELNAAVACFGEGLIAYTGGGGINGMQFIKNTCFRSGLHREILIGGYTVAENPVLSGNNTYAYGAQLGYVAGATGAVVTDNYFPNGLTQVDAEIVTESGNFYGPAPKSGQRVTVYANEYETGRALITVYNWDNADSIAVDVSAILANGAAYALHNTQDYYGDIATGNVAGDGTITIDMRAVSHTVAAVAGGWPSEATVFPEFGCFVLRAG